MAKRFVSVWFRHLSTDWFNIRQPALGEVPFVLSTATHGRMIVTAANTLAQARGAYAGMVVADARALVPSLNVMEDIPGLPGKLLNRIAEWCIRFSPIVAVDLPDGIIIDASGCTHLWGGEEAYLDAIVNRLKVRGYHVRAAMADTIGAAWAVARYGRDKMLIETFHQSDALMLLPPEALRLDSDTVELFYKLGLRHIKDFMGMPRSALRRRFGQEVIKKMNLAIGLDEEIICPVQPVEQYQERLPSLDPIITASGVEAAFRRLLEMLCESLKGEQKGIRLACIKGYRTDGKIEKIEIGTSHPTVNSEHLYKLFEIKLSSFEPGPGIELFVLEANKVEDNQPAQEKIWGGKDQLAQIRLAELIDRLSGKMGAPSIHRYLPAEHFWPERSIELAETLNQPSSSSWKTDKPRPLQLLSVPEIIEVTAPIPDYPPMLFRHKGKLHKVVKADGPERIEQEWWLQEGEHRDYYCVEDEEGNRYWLFRSGHYKGTKTYQWFVHGFFA